MKDYVNYIIALVLLPFAFLLEYAAQAQTPAPPQLICVLALPAGSAGVTSIKLTCGTPQTLGFIGAAGTDGAPGPAGPQGPPGPVGPAGPSGTVTGGACVSGEGTPALFAKLPDGTCLPIIMGWPAPVAAGKGDPGANLLATGGLMVSVRAP